MSHPKHAASGEPEVIAPGPESAVVRRPPRFPAFDGLRAIAAITVVVVHVSFVSGLTPRNPHAVGMYTARLEIGVSVFFLISGFLLYRPFVVAHLAGAPRPRHGCLLAQADPADRAGLLVGALRHHLDSPRRARGSDREAGWRIRATISSARSTSRPRT